MSIGLKRGTVELVEYNPEWAELFEQEKQLLLNTFGDRIIAIEHIGSTAIPDIPAKPIIDMNVAVESIDDIEDFIYKLQELGYEYIPERRYADRQFFPKGPSECRTHHLNLVELDSPTAWRNQLLFRDYLRSHEEDCEAYAELKRTLANQYADNREEYTERKSNFVLKIISKALIEKLKDSFEKSWSAESSFLPEQWNTNNPARGQCAVTALVVQDYLGGEIIKCDVTVDDDSHFYNKLPDGEIVDLTRIQFTDGAKFENKKNVGREKILSHPGTQARYEILKKAVESNF